MFDKKIIKQRLNKLNKAKQYLKTQFIGIDNIIDKFIESVKIWYVLPEIQTKPLIVNIIGITGVGKTDLIRKFVNFIEFNDKFAEIQMDSGDGYGKIEDYLENILDDSEEQGVLLLDEIQRFRTIDEGGGEIRSDKYQDVWMLLSDGAFQSNSRIKQELIGMILESNYYDERHNNEEDVPDEEISKDNEQPKKQDKNKKTSEYKYKTSHWEASRFKKILKLEMSLESIMKLPKDEKLALIKGKLIDKQTYEGKKYHKLLIIISGNLDEAFTMANNVSDSDNDADVYHEYSKTINVIKIKNALKKRFKPEQIARFGNTYLIYPIPNKKAYQEIIIQKINNIINLIKDKHNIIIKVDKSVNNVIYQNGVFPTQGVRPLISTISAILENSLPKFLFEYLNQELKTPITLIYKDNYLQSVVGKQTIKVKVPTVLDDIKEIVTINNKTKISVHEAGHAVLYSCIFKTVPTQIVSSTTSEYSAGFIGVHQNLGSKQDIINSVMVLFGGRLAEQMVFGEEYITDGASGDYAMATEKIANLIRMYGMDESIGIYETPIVNKGYSKHNVNLTDDRIEELLEELYYKAQEILEEQKEFLIEVSEKLIENGSLKLDTFKEIAKKYINDIKIVNPKDDLEIDYNGKLKEFKKLNK